MHNHSQAFSQELHAQWQGVRTWLWQRAQALGFMDLKITDTNVSNAVPKFFEWLDAGHHGQMDYLERHRQIRALPEALHPGAIRSICFTMPYLPALSATEQKNPIETLESRLKSEEERLLKADQAIISLYARGRDYHKILRARLKTLASELEVKLEALSSLTNWDGLQFRVVTDSAPLMEVELATKAGLGWRGKHTLLLNREAGSFFFLGEILINLPLPVDEPVQSHCGTCQACIDICPTQAITAPYQLDARRCISYLTIEHRDAIPEEFRRAIGNRVYGCDDCQLVCPWNKYAQLSTVADFSERHSLGSATLLELWAWSEVQFTERHAGSPILRIGYERWRRNLAIALGNALAASIDANTKMRILEQLQSALPKASPLVAEHIAWALAQHLDR